MFTLCGPVKLWKIVKTLWFFLLEVDQTCLCTELKYCIHMAITYACTTFSPKKKQVRNCQRHVENRAELLFFGRHRGIVVENLHSEINLSLNFTTVYSHQNALFCFKKYWNVLSDLKLILVCLGLQGKDEFLKIFLIMCRSSPNQHYLYVFQGFRGLWNTVYVIFFCLNFL